MRPGVFLDRDGVLNHNVLRDGKPCAPRSLQDFRLLPGVVEAVGQLRQAGFAILVVTNQPDIGNRTVDPKVVDDINRRIQEALKPDALEMCPHAQLDGCACRKPKPGMLLNAAKRLDIALERSFMVGDRFSDIAAGQAAGCFSILVGTGQGENSLVQPDARAADLTEAVALILRWLAAVKP